MNIENTEIGEQDLRKQEQRKGRQKKRAILRAGKKNECYKKRKETA